MNGLVSLIDNPEDLKKLPVSELPKLAQEIRDLIISTVSRTGGHLASSLGTVELAIALHYCYATPGDKIIWDVGHQCYAHKILTGRRERFNTLRDFEGISGFPKREESPYDSFNTGHSSTSISAGLGMATARDIKGEDYKIVCVIGDGSMTGGMAFEGLNNAGGLKKDICVILNDNAMSISKNVGAIATYLNRIITGQFYNRIKAEAESFLCSIPQVGSSIFKIASKLDEAIKSLFVPGVMFEELGFKYVGPVDGHSLPSLIETLMAVKRFKKPILLHVITKKGKGYHPAEKNSSIFHSAAPFSIESGSFKNGEEREPITYTQVFSKAICQLAAQDDRICAITAAMPEGTGLDKFAEKYPGRFFDVGIAEQHAVTFAAGMATQGMRPVIAVYSTFLQRAYDQILHDVCMQNLPVCFAVDRAGIVGRDGPTHNGVFDLSYLRPMPNMIIMAPKDGPELKMMLENALKWEQPVAIRYPKAFTQYTKPDGHIDGLIQPGEGEIIRHGDDCLLLAIGSMVQAALNAAAILALEGIETCVINARFLKPLDMKLISRISKKVHRIITIEENALAGGFGSAVIEAIEKEDLSRRVHVTCMGIPDSFVPAGPRDKVLSIYNLDPEGVARVCQRMMLVKK
ncbi:1-deoxy-D-xylulose-5-phosphate synthase [bacterium]|nr:1-deoxy-D-xylulose-5-phosphate synthase [bacterium]